MRTRLAAWLASALLLAACKSSPPGGGKLDAYPDAASVKVTADGSGFAPASIPAKKGEPVALEFTRTTDQTCATEAVFPDLGLEAKLPLNTPVRVSFKPEKTGDVVFTCGMGMFAGKVIVAEK